MDFTIEFKELKLDKAIDCARKRLPFGLVRSAKLVALGYKVTVNKTLGEVVVELPRNSPIYATIEQHLKEAGSVIPGTKNAWIATMALTVEKG